MFDDDLDEEKISRSDFEIDNTQSSKKALVCGLYHILNNFEHHFDNISTKYKKLALTWILATFAGIGYLLSTKTSTLPFNHLIAVSIVCCLGVIGILALWHLDINVYHRFWIAIYIEEIMMEKTHNFLLPSRNTAMLIDDNRGKISSQSYLYVIAICLFLITMCASIIILINKTSLFTLISTGSIFGILIVTITFVMLKISTNLRNQFNTLIKIKK